VARPGEYRTHGVSVAPVILIFSDGVPGSIGVWIEIPSGTAIPDELRKLAFINAQAISRDDQTLLELSVRPPSIHRHFYHFAVAVSERILVDRRAAIDAVAEELQCFSELLKEKPLLGIERQVGLLGELLVVERLVTAGGPDALAAWIGLLREPHDFRLGTVEFEVKTTVRAQRIHTIHGTEQLIPSKGCSLYLLSVLLGPAGKDAGFSLAEKVKDIATRLAAAPIRLREFTTSLERQGFLEADRPHYTRRFALRRPLAVIKVDRKFPALTRRRMQSVLRNLAARVEALQYDVDVEGLEQEEGTAGFARVFPTR
jgi:hypothetical protein